MGTPLGRSKLRVRDRQIGACFSDGRIILSREDNTILGILKVLKIISSVEMNDGSN